MNRLFYLPFAIGVAAFVLQAGPAVGETSAVRNALIAAYALHDLSAVNLTPDGRAVAWQEAFYDRRRLLESPHYNALYLQRLQGGRRILLTAGERNAYYDEENPVWSPDGRQIAFLSDARAKGQLQLFVAGADGRHVHRLATFNGAVQRLTWAPNGSSLALLYIVEAQHEAGALGAGARDVGVIGTAVDEQRLTTIDARSGAIHLVTPSDTYVYEYGWSPDGRQIAGNLRKRSRHEQLVDRSPCARRRCDWSDARPARAILSNKRPAVVSRRTQDRRDRWNHE